MLRWLCLMLFVLPATAFAGQMTLLPTEKDGWNGGDAAYNHVLSNKQRLWVFGDSLMGSVKGNKRINPAMVRNSVAIESEDGAFRYFVGEGEQGVFSNARTGEWYWPADFVVLGDDAYFFLRRMADGKTDNPLDFVLRGTDMARVENVNAPPKDWKIRYFSIAGDGASVGVAAAKDANYIYLLANKDDKSHAFYLARIARLALAKEVLVLTYYDVRRKRWMGSEPKTPLLGQGAPEASLHYDGTQQLWRLVHSADSLSPKIMLRESTQLTGPWSEAKEQYTCPEAAQSRIICYAGKEIEKRDASEPLAVVYSVNSLEPADLDEDAGLYVTRRITFAE